jgi:hypothetical protein
MLVTPPVLVVVRLKKPFAIPFGSARQLEMFGVRILLVFRNVNG